MITYAASEHVMLGRLLPQEGQIVGQLSREWPNVNVNSLDQKRQNSEHFNFGIRLLNLLHQLAQEAKVKAQIGQIRLLVKIGVVHDSLECQRCLQPYHQIFIGLEAFAEQIIAQGSILLWQFDIHPVDGENQNPSLDQNVTVGILELW